MFPSDQYMMRRKRTEDEEKLLKLLQGMKPQDGFTTWCEQMLHALNTSANNSSSSLDGRKQLSFAKGRAEFNLNLVQRFNHNHSYTVAASALACWIIILL